MGGVTGFELDSAKRRLLEAGCDDEIADALLMACESGALTAIHEKDDSDGGEDPGSRD